MAIVGEKRGLFPALKVWVEAKRPVSILQSFFYAKRVDPLWFHCALDLGNMCWDDFTFRSCNQASIRWSSSYWWIGCTSLSQLLWFTGATHRFSFVVEKCSLSFILAI